MVGVNSGARITFIVRNLDLSIVFFFTRPVSSLHLFLELIAALTEIV